MEMASLAARARTWPTAEAAVADLQSAAGESLIG
jgi:hypothetical protein